MFQSAFSNLLLDIMTHISSTVPEVRLVSRYIGQDQTAIRPAIASPTVLVDIDTANYENLADGSQYIESATISVRLLVDSFSTPSIKPFQKGLMEDFELEKRLVDVLHNWAPGSYCTPLIRTTAASENRHDINLRIRIITFTTSFEEIA